MPMDRYDVDPAVENERDHHPETFFSTLEKISLNKSAPSPYQRPDVEVNDNILNQENQQAACNSGPPTPFPTPKRSLLSWRTDPVSSFSDWTIQIIAVRVDGTNYHTNYFCHSNVLAWGPRKGNIFVTLFEKQRKKSETLKSRIKMEEPEAKLFPVILDFMYCGSTLPLSADRLHILYGLAETLDIPKLKEGMQLFVQNGMDANQLVDFISFVTERNIGATIQRLVLIAESKLFGILVKMPKYGHLIPPKILYRILQKRRQCIDVLKKRNPAKYTQTWENERSKVIGNIVAECCIHAVTSQSPSALTLHILEAITHPTVLPTIDGVTALKLLQVQGILGHTSELGADEHSRQFRSRGRELSHLEKRCIFALVPEWRRMIRDIQPSLNMAIANLTPPVLAELLHMVSEMYEAITPMAGPGPSAYFQNCNLPMEHLEADVLQEMMAPGPSPNYRTVRDQNIFNIE